MRNIIKLLVLLIFQTTFAQEIYLTAGSTEIDLQNAINDSSIGTIYIRTNIQITSSVIITSDKVLNFSAKNKLIIENTGNLIFQNVYIDAGKYQIIEGNSFSGKLTNGIVYSEWFGAIANDNIDDSFSIQKAIDLTNNSVHAIQGEYILNEPIDVTCNLQLNKSIFKFVLDGRKECLRMKDNSSIKYGTIINEGTNPLGSGNYQCPIIIGNYGSGDSYSNVSLEKLTIKTNRINGNGIMVTGGSNQIRIQDIYFPDSDKLGRAILVHWGGAGSVENNDINERKTYHPNNILISNISIGDMTLDQGVTDSSKIADTGGIFISGAYNIKVSNVRAKELHWRNGLIVVFAGDYGNEYVANTNIKNFINEGIIFENCSVDLAYSRVLKISCQQSKPAPDPDISCSNNGKPILSGPILINITAKASNNNSTHGFLVGASKNTIIKNGKVEGFDYGLVTDKKVTNLIIDGGEYFNNKKYGFSISNGCYPPENTTIMNSQTHHNSSENGNYAGIYIGKSIRSKIVNNIIGKQGETQFYGIEIDSNAKNTIIDSNTIKFSLKSGIYINNGDNCRILNNIIGAEENETQKWGVRIGNDSKDNIIENNFVNNATHSAFSIGSSTTYGVVYRFKGNLASNSVGIFHSGVSPMIIDTKIVENTNLLIRECIGRGIPINGYWNKGDKVYNSFVNSSFSNGWVCVQSGEGNNAIWKSFGLID